MTDQNIPEDDMKRKFREALAKKNGQQHLSADGAANRGAVNEPHGKAGAKRTFRRKAS